MEREPLLVKEENVLPEIQKAETAYSSLSSSHGLAKAKEMGWGVVFPDKNQLLIDIDKENDLSVFNENIEIFQKHVMKVLSVHKAPSKSGNPGKYHITVTLEKGLSNVERVMFQAFLGSDRKRELLSYGLILKGDPFPIFFFEKKTVND